MKGIDIRFLAGVLIAAPCPAPAQATPQAAQNPSPMIETTRAHERLSQRAFEGHVRSFAGPDGKAVDVYIPTHLRGDAPIDVVIQFLGASWVTAQAIDALGSPT